tara:strand:- start:287 stop:1477 length:1191 start_codon:yes stop_codon:yes gene_type:complete
MSQELENAIEGINAKSQQINANEVEVKAVVEKTNSLELELKGAKDEIVKLSEKVAANAEKEIIEKDMEKKSDLRKEIEAKEFKLDGKNEVKAILDYSSLTQTGQLDQVDTTIAHLPYKMPKVVNLFRKIAMTTEVYSYIDQKSINLDAQGVAKCSTGFTSLTADEKELVRVNDVLLKDSTGICLDYASDYNFVEPEARFLLETSMVDIIETELVLGADSSTSLKSIDSVSSEFSATNVSAPLNGSIQDANFADLLLGMKMQINVLGKLGSFRADTALVNEADMFKLIESAKDSQGQYLDPRVTVVGGQLYVGSLALVSSLDVVANTAYVFDRTKGAILDRRMTTLQMSTENGTNFIDGEATLKATARLNFLVKNSQATAFMKCSDVETAITAIKSA